MFNPDQLTESQIETIKQWAAGGDDLNAIQKKLHEELNLKLTFMDTRFLLQDLEIALIEPEPVKEEVSEAPQAPASLIGQTQVSVDEITPPHALMSGKVMFKSGAQGVWSIDRSGRVNWEPTMGEPTPDDMKEFEAQLQQIIRSRVGGL